MTKKDFVEIATIVASLPSDGSRWYAASAFARYLATTNPRFDRKRFMTACKEPELTQPQDVVE